MRVQVSLQLSHISTGKVRMITEWESVATCVRESIVDRSNNNDLDDCYHNVTADCSQTPTYLRLSILVSAQRNHSYMQCCDSVHRQ